MCMYKCINAIMPIGTYLYVYLPNLNNLSLANVTITIILLSVEFDEQWFIYNILAAYSIQYYKQPSI